jgi:inner membrane protein
VLSALHFLTHIGLSWMVANVGPASRRDRWLIVLAGILPDLDGIGILWSERAYEAAHRAAGHGLPFALVLIAITVLCAHSPWATSALAALSFHLHLLLDVVGTGGLPIRYLWPFTDWGWSYSGHWVLASWPNAVVMGLTLLGVLLIGWRSRRTPHAGS